MLWSLLKIVIFIGMPPAILLVLMMMSLRGAGDSRTPLYAAVLANIVNVVVAYLLIFGNAGLPALGVAGSAWGAAGAAPAC